MDTYYGRNFAKTYTLDQRLGGGGEGMIYSIRESPNLVAKLYKDEKLNPSSSCHDPRGFLREKLLTMLDQPVSPYVNGDLVVAWPQDILQDRSGSFLGYVMPRVQSRHFIFNACRERERVMLFPNYDYTVAIAIAFNLAISIQNIHAAGAVMGDLNPNNIMLNEKGKITLIDTDSFNIQNRDTGKIYKCMVGVPEVLAPELQGRDLRNPNSKFTQFSDCFSLAIHVFNLLMNNCHPFGCKGLNSAHGSQSNNPVAHNIVNGYCPYISGSGRVSPSAPDYKMLPSYIQDLFAQTFHYTIFTAAKPETIARRPTAEQWASALYRFYQEPMVSCSHGHKFPKSYHSSCPWCKLTQQNGPAPAAPFPVHTPAAQAAPSFATKPHAAAAGKAHVPACRSAWPLWALCILVGLFSAPVMAPWLQPVLNDFTGLTMTETVVRLILLVTGGLAGTGVAYLAKDYYTAAVYGWPWLLCAIPIPIFSVLLLIPLGYLAGLLYSFGYILLILLGLMVFILVLKGL